VCFFFQAEDGIRDFHVTGVQTCALPISRRRSRPLGDAARQGETVGAQAIHLPVAGNKGLSLSHFHSPRSRSERRRRMVAAPPARLYTFPSTITPARPCCKRSAPERVPSSSRSCLGS